MSTKKLAQTFITVLQFDGHSLMVKPTIDFPVGRVVIQPLVCATDLYKPGNITATVAQYDATAVGATTTHAAHQIIYDLPKPATPNIIMLETDNSDIPIVGSYVGNDHVKAPNLHPGVEYNFAEPKWFRGGLLLKAYLLEPHTPLELLGNVLIQMQFYEY